MKTYKEFIEEGLRKDIARVIYATSIENPKKPPITDYGDHPPGSPERRAAIQAMMKNQGGKAVERDVAKRLKKARKEAGQLIRGKSKKQRKQIYQDLITARESNLRLKANPQTVH